jgi:hypothetical protein
VAGSVTAAVGQLAHVGGAFRRNSSTTGTTASAQPLIVSDAARQPSDCTTCEITGRKISCPVALAAVRTPETRPRRATNHRPTTVATSAIAIDRVPSPTITPHSVTSCHDAVMKTVRPLPAATISKAIATTRRTPKRSMSAAANGPTRP